MNNESSPIRKKKRGGEPCFLDQHMKRDKWELHQASARSTLLWTQFCLFRPGGLVAVGVFTSMAVITAIAAVQWAKEVRICLSRRSIHPKYVCTWCWTRNFACTAARTLFRMKTMFSVESIPKRCSPQKHAQPAHYLQGLNRGDWHRHPGCTGAPWSWEATKTLKTLPKKMRRVDLYSVDSVSDACKLVYGRHNKERRTRRRYVFFC